LCTIRRRVLSARQYAIAGFSLAILLAPIASASPAEAAQRCSKSTHCETSQAKSRVAHHKSAVSEKSAAPVKSAIRQKSAAQDKTAVGDKSVAREKRATNSKGRRSVASAAERPTQASDLAHRAQSDRCTEQARQDGLQGKAWEDFLVKCLTQ
jgi:hypothetical protein